MPKVERIAFKGTFSSRDEGAAQLKQPGDAALVERGVPRMLLLHCPCRCGDTLVINLDRRTGPAWRFYLRNNRFTLFPSYWRDSKCGSHFILWNNHVLWCDWDEDSPRWSSSSAIEDQVLRKLSSEWTSYEELAESLDEIPWDVLQACYSLVRKNLVEKHPDHRSGKFRRKSLGRW